MRRSLTCLGSGHEQWIQTAWARRSRESSHRKVMCVNTNLLLISSQLNLLLAQGKIRKSFLEVMLCD